MKLEEINIHDIGNTIQLSGLIFSGKGKNLLCFLPDEKDASYKTEHLDMDLDEWKKVIRQTDLLETEIIESAKDGKLVKTILRKSSRQIDQGVSWKVYERDNYRCQYCYIKGIPMTVDHLVLWEKGGPSIEENLLTSCRKCNKLRGNMPYEEWLYCDKYNRFNKLPIEVHEKNICIINDLKNIPIRKHKKSR